MLKRRTEQKMLSIASKARFGRLRIAAAACAMSVIISVGFAGVSIKTRLRLFAFSIASVSALVLPAGTPRASKPKRLDYLVDQVLGAAIQRLGVHDEAAALEEREHNGEDRGDAGIEDGGGVGAALSGTSCFSRISALG